MSKQTDLLNLTDAITVDGSNVGIGTGSPDAPLTIENPNVSGEQNIITVQQNGTGTSTLAKVTYNQAEDSLKIINASSYSGSYLGFGTNGSERMRIDSAGCVTTPYQPMFHATRTVHVASSGDITFNQVNRNVGGHYNASNGRFTAPISGNYLFCFSTLLYNLGYSTNARLQLNGGIFYGMSSLGTYGQHTGVYSGQGGSTIVHLNAGDYVAINVSHNGTNLHANYTFFSGQMIG